MGKSITVCSVIVLLIMGRSRAGWTILDMPGASSTEAWGIDDNNIVGDYYDASGRIHGFLYNGSTWITLSAPGATNTFAHGISGSKIVGSYEAGSCWHGFLYNGSTWTTIDYPGDVRHTSVFDIDGSNLVGFYSDASGKGHGFFYDGSNWTTLYYMPGAYLTIAFGIDGSNIVGVHSDIYGNYEHGFLYNGSTWTTIEYLGVGTYTEIHGIDGSNLVGSENASYYDHGFLYNESTWTTLSAPGATNTYAYSISGRNIVGCYFDAYGLHGFVYTIPEPAIPPVANADGPYTIYVGDTLTLNASGSTDDENNIVSYIWDLDDNNSFETDAGSNAVFDINYACLQSLGLLVGNAYKIHLKITDSGGLSNIANSTLTIIPAPALRIIVDIKPGSCPNPLNVKSSGVLPVAILGTADFDVTTIDATSIRLAGVSPLRSGIEDAGGPAADSNDCNCTEDGPDGLADLTLKFKTERIVEAIGDVNEGDVLTLELSGVLIGERPIEGADCVVVGGKHKPCNKFDINEDGVVDYSDFCEFAQNWMQSSIDED